jgi:hypothetical protein
MHAEVTMMMSTKKRARRRLGQSMTEYIILVALAALSLVWIVTRFPAAITDQYKRNVKFLAGPF